MQLGIMMLAVSLSIDSLGVGITYGIKNTKISFIPKTILFLISFCITVLSLTIGNIIIKFLPEFTANLLGCILLCFMGIWIIYQGLKPDNKVKKKKEYKFSQKEKIYNFFIKPLGITIKIIKDPISSDLDGSKSIDKKEALYLGFAMSIDSFCSGIGVSIIGVKLLSFPFWVAGFQILFLSFGNFLGKKIKKISNLPPSTWNIISGALLIVISIIKLIFM